MPHSTRKLLLDITLSCEEISVFIEDKDFEDAAMDELYLLTSDEDQSEDIRSSRSDLMDVLESKFTTFLNKNATHSGQLATPEKAVNWQDFVTSE